MRKTLNGKTVKRFGGGPFVSREEEEEEEEEEEGR